MAPLLGLGPLLHGGTAGLVIEVALATLIAAIALAALHRSRRGGGEEE